MQAIRGGVPPGTVSCAHFWFGGDGELDGVGVGVIAGLLEGVAVARLVDATACLARGSGCGDTACAVEPHAATSAVVAAATTSPAPLRNDAISAISISDFLSPLALPTCSLITLITTNCH